MAISRISRVSLGIMLLPLSTSVATVELWIIYLQSVPSLVMRKSARRLVKRVPKQGTLREVAVVEAVEVVMDMEVEQVVENVLLGVIVLQKAPTPVCCTSKVLGRCIVLNVVGGMKHTLPSITKLRKCLPQHSRCQHTIRFGFCQGKSTLLLQLV